MVLPDKIIRNLSTDFKWLILDFKMEGPCLFCVVYRGIKLTLFSWNLSGRKQFN